MSDHSLGGGDRPLRQLDRLMDGLPAVLAVLAPDGTIVQALGGVEELLGIARAEAEGTNALDYLVPGQEERALVSLAEALERQADFVMGPFRVWLRNARTGEVLVEVWSHNLGNDPVAGGMECLILFESAQLHFDRVLASVAEGAPRHETFALLTRALRGHPVTAECLFLDAGALGGSVHAAADAERVVGPPGPGPWHEVLASGVSVELSDLSQLREPLRSEAMAAGYRSLTVEPVRDDLEGELCTSLVLWRRIARPLTANQRDVVDRAVTIASMALGRARAERRLQEAAFEDPLTGLGNRRRLLGSVADRISDEAAEAAVLFIDFDSFKAVNDRYGHRTGDDVLLESSKRLVAAIRPTDEVIRLGGDEFAVVCHGALTFEQVTSIADRIIAAMSEPIAVAGGEAVRVGASVGIAHGFPAGTPLELLLARADAALYEAKARGKGRWFHFDANPPADRAPVS